MNKELIIVGDGNQANVISSIIDKDKIRIVGFYRLSKKKSNSLFKKKYKIFNKISEFRKVNNKNLYFIVGIGDNNIRKKVVDQFNDSIRNIKWYTAISSKSIISKNVNIGKGTVIMPGCIINNDSKIGKHCIVNTKSIIEHDNTLGDFSSTGPGVITGGNVKIGKKSFLGMASVIKNNVKIGYNTIIGAKSLVLKNCKSNSKYFGTPAKKNKF